MTHMSMYCSVVICIDSFYSNLNSIVSVLQGQGVLIQGTLMCYCASINSISYIIIGTTRVRPAIVFSLAAVV